jgi:AcrR family transcriptional regulator
VARAGLSPDAVVDAAIDLLDRSGTEPTLAAVAAHTGVAAPSLYKHVRNLAELRRLVGLRVLEDVSEQLNSAILGLSGDQAVAALMHAWRDYARQYPHRYAAMPLQPLTDPFFAPAAPRLMASMLAVVRFYGFSDAAAIHAVRRLRATVHGFAVLDGQGGFGLDQDVDVSFQQLVDMVIASMHRPGEEDQLP